MTPPYTCHVPRRMHAQAKIHNDRRLNAVSPCKFVFWVSRLLFVHSSQRITRPHAPHAPLCVGHY